MEEICAGSSPKSRSGFDPSLTVLMSPSVSACWQAKHREFSQTNPEHCPQNAWKQDVTRKSWPPSSSCTASCSQALMQVPDGDNTNEEELRGRSRESGLDPLAWQHSKLLHTMSPMLPLL